MAEDLSIITDIVKTNEDQRLVFGFASISEDHEGNLIIDSDGEVIKAEELEKAAYDFVLNVRKAGEMHVRIEGVGQMVESVFLNKEKQAAMGIPEGSVPVGWWVGFKVSEDVFAKVKSGEYQAFSIGGIGRARPHGD